jgi:putative methyltransferase (TIGR04325 family)
MPNRLRQWLPPILIERLRPVLGRGIYFSGHYDDWASARASATGYDADVIVEKVKRATLEVIAGRAAFERDSVLFASMKYPFQVIAGLLRAAAENHGRLSVLDIGGSLGSTYFQCRGFLSVLDSLAWNVVEQPNFVRAGRECIQSDSLKFYSTVGEALAEHGPNVALLSSALQYLPEPYATLTTLMESRIRYLIIDRTPLSEERQDAITVQHVPPSIYPASYPCRIFGKRALAAHVSAQYETVATFESEDDRAVANGLRFAFGGMLLRRR